MRGRAAFLALLLPCLAAADTAVEVVVDASASMGEPLEGARTRLAAAQVALDAVVAALPAGDPGVAVGLRVNGGAVPWSSPEACDDSSLLVAPAPSSAPELLAALAGLRSGGADLAARSIQRAAEDLAVFEGRRLVVLVTDGDGGACEGDWAAVAEALQASSAELWVVGGGLGEAASAVAERAHLEPAGTTADLRAAILKGIGSAVTLDPTPLRVLLRVHRGGEPVALEETALVDLGGAQSPLVAEGGALTSDAPPGVYQVSLAEPGGPTWALAGLRVHAGAATELDFELPRPEEVLVEVVGGPASVRGEVSVRYAGARPGSSWLTMVPPGAPAGDRGVDTVRLDQSEGEAKVGAPERAGPAEVRLHLEVGAGASLVAARAGLPVQPLVTPLEAGAEVEVGDSVRVTWRAPVVPGDCVAMVPAGTGEAPPASCLPVVGPEPVEVGALPALGPAQIRFFSGRSACLLAQSPVEVVPARPRLEPPERVGAGESFEVPWSWRGEPGPYDYLAVAAADAADGEYLTFVPAVAGEVARLRAPAEPGSYEVRYVSGQGDRTLANARVEVGLSAVTLSGPPEAGAGTRVTVRWTGPDRTGDLVAVAPAGSDSGRMLDWAYTSEGSPLTVAAPERPGEYELRYLSDGKVLARAKLMVRPPG